MSPRWEPDPNVRRGRSVMSNLHAHLVFTPKYCKDVFTSKLLMTCESAMRKVCDDFDVELTEFNGECSSADPVPADCPTVLAGQLSQRRILTHHAPRSPSRGEESSVGRSFMVTVLLCRLMRRGATVNSQGLHHQSETTGVGSQVTARLLPALNDRGSAAQNLLK